MRTEEKEKKTVVKFFCDVCKKEITTMYSSKQCLICGKHICLKHSYHDYPFGGDHPEVYCLPCWDAGDKYRKMISEANEIHDNHIETLHIRWKYDAKRRGK